jgi:hypothetical protein
MPRSAIVLQKTQKGIHMKKAVVLMFIMVLSFFATDGLQLVNFAKANPLPPMYTEITIDKPVNTTYNVNIVHAIFSVDTDYSLNSYFYSLDGQPRKSVENITIFLQEDINIGKNPRINRTVVNGSFVLSGLSEGWHNLTIYQISHLIGGDPDYEIPFSESIQFKTDTTLPTALAITVSAASVTIILGCLLVYFKKRKR